MRFYHSLLLAVKVFGGRETTRNKLNDLGDSDDPTTVEFYKFLDPLMRNREE